jgi:hypothetical protein
MFEDILDGFKDLEDELEKTGPATMPDPDNTVSLDSEGWDTGGGDAWDTDQRTPDEDTIWRA